MEVNMPGGANECSTVPVVPRSVWGAKEVQTIERTHTPVNQVIIHHTALWSCRNRTQSIDQLTHIQHTHIHQRGFNDIAYNFLVDQAGVVYEGRGWGIVGAHAKTHNHNSVGVAFIGNFNDESPSSEALSAVRALIQDGVTGGYLHPQCVIRGHRDVSDTECPGKKLYSSLHTLQLK